MQKTIASAILAKCNKGADISARNKGFTMHLREYTAMTKSSSGATESVTVVAFSTEDAKNRLVRMGYHSVLWVV